MTVSSPSYSATIPNQNHTNQNIYPWPYFLVLNGASVTIAGVTSGQSCNFTAAVNSSTHVITWTRNSCTNLGNYPVNCTGNICYLPWNNF